MRGDSARFRGSWDTGVEMNAGNRTFVRGPTATFCLLEFRRQITTVQEVAILSCVKANRGVLKRCAGCAADIFPSRYLPAHIILMYQKYPRKYPARGHTRRKLSMTTRTA